MCCVYSKQKKERCNDADCGGAPSINRRFWVTFSYTNSNENSFQKIIKLNRITHSHKWCMIVSSNANKKRKRIYSYRQ